MRRCYISYSGGIAFSLRIWWDNQSMTTRQALIVGGIVELVVSSALLASLWFGVAGVLVVGKTNLMYVSGQPL
jgi:hypothetical protein